MSSGEEKGVRDKSPQAVDFLIRTMIERDKEGGGKRQIKPKNIEDALMVGDDSDEDPDFSIKEESSNSDSDIDITESERSDEEGEEEGQDGEDSSSESESGSSDSDGSGPRKTTLREAFAAFDAQTNEYESQSRRKKRRKPKPSRDDDFSIDTSKKKKKPPPKKKKKIIVPKKPIKKLRVSKRPVSKIVGTTKEHLEENRANLAQERDMVQLVCSVCLGVKSDGTNEIVECDSCGITCHEACYSVSDTGSVASGTGSSFSTEPWFCDFCKRGEQPYPNCELCPNTDGLFKETKQGHWVHLVCALYTPGVKLGDSDLPDLSEVNYNKWGSYGCAYCENERLARTGVCIPCDAGLCKTYLHATCAQKYGLLSDPNPENSEGTEDPYYLSCKLHSHKDVAKARSLMWGRLMEGLRVRKEAKSSAYLTEKEKENQERILRKLDKVRSKIEGGKTPLGENSASSLTKVLESLPVDIKPSPPRPSTSTALSLSSNNTSIKKKGRFLHTSSFSCNSFNRKADAMGPWRKGAELEEKNRRLALSVKRKWNIPPGLNVSFAAYYTDREVRIKDLTDQCLALDKDTKALGQKESALKAQWETQLTNNQVMMEENDRLNSEINSLKSFLGTLHPNYKPPKTTTPKAKPLKRSSFQGKSTEKRVNYFNSRSPLAKERLCLMMCSICSKSDLQHLITKCDECSRNFHIGCLDPPLTRIPKKTRQCGWMCSDCFETETTKETRGEEEDVDTAAPRSLRGRTSIKKPGKYRASNDFGAGGSPLESRKRKSGAQENCGKKKKKRRFPPKLSSAAVNEKNDLYFSIERVSQGGQDEAPEDPKVQDQGPPEVKLTESLDSSPPRTRRPSSPSKVAAASPLVNGGPSPKQPLSVKVEENAVPPSSVESKGEVSSPKKVSPKGKDGKNKGPPRSSNGVERMETLIPWACGTAYSFSDGMEEGKCATCNKLDDQNLMVMCDKCGFSFHFCCLSPPLKYTPKRRGYSWFCRDCEETDVEEEVEAVIP